MPEAARTGNRRRRALRKVVAFALAAGFVSFVVYRSFFLPRVRCELCLTYRGQAICRTVEAADPAEARSAALTTACAVVASGVTDTMACERTPPQSFSCEPVP